jgi:signal transduction histidine kinase
MDIPSLLLFLVTATNLLLGLVVFFRNPNSKQFQYYLWLALAISGWTLTNGLFRVVPLTYLLPIALFSYFFAGLIALTFFLFNTEYAHIPKKRAGAAYVIIGLVCSAMGLIPFAVADSVSSARVITTTDGLYAYAVYLVVYFGWGFMRLLQGYRHSDPVRHRQTKVILSGMLTAVILGITFNLILPIFGSYQLVFLGPLCTVIYLFAVAYAIVKHRLFDIRLVVARSVTYVLLLGSLSILYGAGLFGVTNLLFPHQTTSRAQSLVSIGLALILAFTFQPLRRFFQKLTDNIFYRDHYASQEVLNGIGKILASELLLEKLLLHTLQQLCVSMHIEAGQFIIFEGGQVYKTAHYGPLPRKMLIASTAEKLRQSILVADELEGGERKQILEEHGIRVSLMLRTRDEFVGYLLLGDKLSGDIYSKQDIDLLEIMAREISIAIINAKAYEEIAAFNVTLQEKVDHATARLRTANKHLQEVDESKDEFISMAAHQLRTPLTTIKGYLSMMLEGDAGKMTSNQTQFSTYAFEGAERMVSLVSDLLNVARMSSGKFMIERQPTDILALVQDEIRQLESHAKAKDLKLIFDPAAGKLPLVDIDADKTRQVIMNFVDNAIYYTAQGSVRIEVKVDKKTLRLTVTDTGIGVPEVAQKHLFTKFYRADNAQKMRPDGTGLGLYLAKRVIEDQGGTIIFESSEGHGSTFGFELPLK